MEAEMEVDLETSQGLNSVKPTKIQKSKKGKINEPKTMIISWNHFKKNGFKIYLSTILRTYCSLI